MSKRTGRKVNTLKDFLQYIRFPKTKKGCWIWLAGKDKDGYGIFSVNDKSHRAHRYMAALKWKNIKGLKVCHTCDNPSCVRPSHFFLGTNLQNTRDRNLKGRQVRGERCHTSKVTPKIVRRIRFLSRTTNLTHLQISEVIGKLSPAQTSSIIRGDSWKHI